MVKNDKKVAAFSSVFKNGNACDFIKARRCRGKRRIKGGGVSAKWFKCDSYVSDYVFAHCRDMVDLMRRGAWEG